MRVSIFIGNLTHLPESGRMTGIYKYPVNDRVEVTSEGFAGDHQADRRIHGGPEKAVHLYPARHYARLSERFPEAADRLCPGSMGENISAPDIDEEDVRIGEIWRLGSALLQVCQPRNPCWKIDEKFATPGMAAFIAEQCLTGWYCRVLEMGYVFPGDELELKVPASGAQTLGEVLRLVRADRPDIQELARLAATPGIAVSWKQRLDYQLEWLRKNTR